MTSNVKMYHELTVGAHTERMEAQKARVEQEKAEVEKRRAEVEERRAMTQAQDMWAEIRPLYIEEVARVNATRRTPLSVLEREVVKDMVMRAELPPFTYQLLRGKAQAGNLWARS